MPFKDYFRSEMVMFFRKQLSKLFFGLLIYIVCGIAFTVKAETIKLASNGSPNYHIVYSASASSTEKFAINELKKYLDQISKANFVLSNRLTNHSIVTGSVSLIQKIAPDIKIPPLEKEGYVIYKREQNLYLVGGSDRSVLYAVYDFLASLGCRWIAPDFECYEGSSHYIPEQTELNYIHLAELTQRPALKYRKLYIEEGLSHNTQNLLTMIDWMPKVHFNTLVAPLNYQGKGRVQWDNWRKQLIPELKKRGIIIEVGGHGYQNFLNAEMEDGQLFKKHSEWFGQNKDGNRSPNPNVVFCTSNPEAIAYLHNNILIYLQTHPEIDIFDFWPPDGAKWCECPKCKTLGTVTDRHVLLVSQTAQLLRKENPNVKLECLAYASYVEPPQHEILDKNVLLDFCPIKQNFEYQIYQDSSIINKAYKENLVNWLKAFKGDISIYSYYRKYSWRSLPNIIPHYMQNDLRFYRDIGAKGISVYSEPGDWFTYGLNHYVLGHLAWNPDVDADSLITEYCTKLYGPAANIAVFVYTNLENIVRFGSNIPFTKPKSAEQYRQFITKLNTCSSMVTAAIKQYSSDQVLCRHLNRLGLMLEYVDKNIAIMHLTAQGDHKEETDRIADDIEKMINENASSGVFVPREQRRVVVPLKVY